MPVQISEKNAFYTRKINQIVIHEFYVLQFNAKMRKVDIIL